jgi:hypothetical protein
MTEWGGVAARRPATVWLATVWLAAGRAGW